MKFSIRDLMLVTAIVALALGWWLDRTRLANEMDRLERRHRLTQILTHTDADYGPVPTYLTPVTSPPKP